MMRVQDYCSASDELRSLILCQAELRLSDQHAFAEAADARAAIVTGSAVSLAAASVGVFAASLDGSVSWSLALGGLAGAVGFVLAARKALKSARCVPFHPKGFSPRDFATDILEHKSIAQTQAEMAEDMDGRLEFNSTILRERGDLIDSSMSLMGKTPIFIAVAALIGAAVQAAFGA